MKFLLYYLIRFKIKDEKDFFFTILELLIVFILIIYLEKI
ncbi:hypothetical protein HMPREF9954_2232 [Streptococcus infantis SK970]|nr:hypothetical protein HMPREF9954_2232 [Streptococcus infantis SK970]